VTVYSVKPVMLVNSGPVVSDNGRQLLIHCVKHVRFDFVDSFLQRQELTVKRPGKIRLHIDQITRQSLSTDNKQQTTNVALSVQPKMSTNNWFQGRLRGARGPRIRDFITMRYINLCFIIIIIITQSEVCPPPIKYLVSVDT